MKKLNKITDIMLMDDIDTGFLAKQMKLGQSVTLCNLIATLKGGVFSDNQCCFAGDIVAALKNKNFIMRSSEYEVPIDDANKILARLDKYGERVTINPGKGKLSEKTIIFTPHIILTKAYIFRCIEETKTDRIFEIEIECELLPGIF